ncbi:MAG: DUF3786 domain-containing protein [Faecousia sp.]
MDNYKKMQESARAHFLEYDYGALCRRRGVKAGEDGLVTRFLGQQVFISRKTGEITVDGRKATFSEALTVYDWLCDGQKDAQAAGKYCTISSLPGVFVSGSGLEMNGNSVATLIEANRAEFLELCRRMDGQEVTGADLAVVIWLFPDLPMLLKFYGSDEDFPASLTFLWDANILRFIRYETIYYLAGCLLKRIRNTLSHP